MNDYDKRVEQEAKEFAKIAAENPPVDGPAQPVRIHPAASVILVRESGGGEIEVLLAKRSQNVRFMPGAWVFPGGRLDAADGEEDLEAFKRCAAREAAEEAGVAIADPSVLVWFSHWITPQGLPHRFDTRFFLAPAPPGDDLRADGQEVEELRWVTPTDALAANEADTMTIFFPTLKQLERIVGVVDYAAACDVANNTPIVPVTPKVVIEDGQVRIALPGDPGYDE